MSASEESYTIKPYDNNTPLMGEGRPPLETVEDWIRMLVTVYKRMGNTATIGKTHLAWGASALWAESKCQDENASLRSRVEALERALAILRPMAMYYAEGSGSKSIEWQDYLTALALAFAPPANEGTPERKGGE